VELEELVGLLTDVAAARCELAHERMAEVVAGLFDGLDR
jgi:hypothetical protein